MTPKSSFSTESYHICIWKKNQLRKKKGDWKELSEEKYETGHCKGQKKKQNEN